jgi:hypothetical protein
MQLNYIIVYCSNQIRSFVWTFQLTPTRFCPFHVVSLDNEVSLDY